MKKILFSLLLITLLFTCIIVEQKEIVAYEPVLSGKFDSGERIYTNFDQDENEEIDDKYHYNRFWVNYKQKLTTSEYYYLKFQYYKKDYYFSDTYNNIGLDFWGNYTYKLNDKTRNRLKINIKDKNYFSNQEKSYKALRIDYEMDYDYDQKNDYGLILQRQWNDFSNDYSKNYFRDKIKIEWDYDYSDRFQIESSFQYERQIYNFPSESSNKYGTQLSISFDYEL